MDTVTTIIVTVLANAIVMGGIVYLLQKRIESSFARKLEEFKAQLQYANFEQQTKFVQIHTKRVETLEKLCKRFAEYYEDFHRLVSAGHEFIRWGRLTINLDELDHNRLMLHEWSVYLSENQLFVPRRLLHDLHEIESNSATLAFLLRYPFHKDRDLSFLLRSENETLKTTKLKIRPIDLEKPDFEQLLLEINNEMIMQRIKLESVYRSVAQIGDLE